MKKILILTANPKNTAGLRLEEEVREIKAGIQRSRHRDQFAIEYQMAARPRDVQRAMLDYKPQIVHFCGHGAGDKGLVLEDEAGQIKAVSTPALATLFDLFADQVECVLLNACYSKVQAKAIARHINYVIGMSQAIGDRAAIEFATSFYDALGAGEAVEFAFRLGKNAMQLAGIAEENTPVLIAKPIAKSNSQSKVAAVPLRDRNPQPQPTLESTPSGPDRAFSSAISAAQQPMKRWQWRYLKRYVTITTCSLTRRCWWAPTGRSGLRRSYGNRTF